MTAHDRELMARIANGEKTPEIAKNMRHTVGAIEQYRHELYRKLNVRNAPHLVAYGFKKGILK